MPYHVDKEFHVPTQRKESWKPGRFCPPRLIRAAGLTLFLTAGCKYPLVCGPITDQKEGHVIVVEWAPEQLSTWAWHGKIPSTIKEGSGVLDQRRACQLRRIKEIESIQRRLRDEASSSMLKSFALE